MTTTPNEDTRVKIPLLLHSTRLGYKYIPRKYHKNLYPKTKIDLHILQKALTQFGNQTPAKEIAEELTKLANNTKDKRKSFWERITDNTNKN